MAEMIEIDREAWMDAVRNEDSFSRRRALLSLRRDLFAERWLRIKNIDWKPFHWNPTHAGEIYQGEVRRGPLVDLPELLQRVADSHLDLRLRQMALGCLQPSVLDDLFNSPDAPFMDGALVLAHALVGFVCTPEPALRLSAACVLDALASSCRPWFDPGEPPVAGIAGVVRWFGYVERVEVWRILDAQSLVFVPLLMDDYDAVRTVGSRLISHFPAMSEVSMGILQRVLQNEPSEITRDELALCYAVLLSQSGRPVDLSGIPIGSHTEVLIEGLRQYPNIDHELEAELDRMRRTMGCDRLLMGPGWRAHVLLQEANARKAGFTEYVSHDPRPHFS